MEDHSYKKEYRSDSGQIIAQGIVKDSHPIGLWTIWHNNGVLAKQFVCNQLKSGEVKISGMIKEWFSNSQPALEGEYSLDDYGGMEGLWRAWDEEGNLILRHDYRLPEAKLLTEQARKSLAFKEYTQTDEPKDGYARFLICLPEGKSAFWEGYLSNSIKEGWWKLWLNDGRVIVISQFKNGVVSGMAIVLSWYLLRLMIKLGFEEFKNLKNSDCISGIKYFKDGALQTEK
jgi:antitoxin component YwqK of YwqJK toxin-antitoxin module